MGLEMMKEGRVGRVPERVLGEKQNWGVSGGVGGGEVMAGR